MMEDERIKIIWLQTSGTGMSDHNDLDVEYFNKVTRNNQGNVEE